MLKVQQFLGRVAQTVVQGDLKDGVLIIETTIEGKGMVLAREYEVDKSELSVNPVTMAGFVDHNIKNGTSDDLVRLLYPKGVTFHVRR